MTTLEMQSKDSYTQTTKIMGACIALIKLEMQKFQTEISARVSALTISEEQKKQIISEAVAAVDIPITSLPESLIYESHLQEVETFLREDINKINKQVSEKISAFGELIENVKLIAESHDHADLYSPAKHNHDTVYLFDEEYRKDKEQIEESINVLSSTLSEELKTTVDNVLSLSEKLDSYTGSINEALIVERDSLREYIQSEAAAINSIIQSVNTSLVSSFAEISKHVEDTRASLNAEMIAYKKSNDDRVKSVEDNVINIRGLLKTKVDKDHKHDYADKKHSHSEFVLLDDYRVERDTTDTKFGYIDSILSDVKRELSSKLDKKDALTQKDMDNVIDVVAAKVKAMIPTPVDGKDGEEWEFKFDSNRRGLLMYKKKSDKKWMTQNLLAPVQYIQQPSFGGGGGAVYDLPASGGQDSIVDISVPFTGEPTGFENRTDSIISFSDIDRTFFIAPVATSYNLFLASERFEKTTLDSVMIPDVTAEYYIYFDSVDKQLKVVSEFNPDIFAKHAIVSVLYWQKDQQKAIYFADERHGIVMDGATHKHLHLTLGAQYRFGFDIHDIQADQNGALDSHAQISVTGGRIADEDIDIDVVHNQPQRLLGIAQLPVFYRLGSDFNWYKTEADLFPLISSGDVPGYVGTKPAYNRKVNGQWVIQETITNKFVLMHVVATNNINEPVIVICGNEYETKGTARENARTELLNITGLPFAEFVPIGTVIYQVNDEYANTVNARIVSTDDGFAYVDFRNQDLNIPLSTGGSATPTIRVVSIPLSGITRTIVPSEHNLTKYYSYKTVDSQNKEVSLAITEQNLTFTIESNLNMSGLRLLLRGI